VVHDEVAGSLGDPGAVGCGVAPKLRIRRWACSITASMYMRVPVSVVVLKKSQASRTSAWSGGTAPRCSTRVGARVHTRVGEDLPYGGCGDLQAVDEELAVDLAVAPARILLRQAQDQQTDRAYGARSSRTFRSGHCGVAAAEQLAVQRRIVSLGAPADGVRARSDAVVHSGARRAMSGRPE
jgi:hypothetical protein